MSKLGELARQSVVVVARNHWDTLRVTGADRRTWLEGLVTCELKALNPGQGTWGLALNRLGKIQSVLWVVATADSLWLAIAPGTLATLEPEFAKMLIMEDAELERPAEVYSWFALHGPRAAERAAELAQLVSGHAAPIDWTGLGGAALVVPEARAAELLAACHEQLLPEAEWTRLRLERGLPEFGVDFDTQERPHEVGLERRAVSWTKGCYLGQEVVCMQDMRGKVKRSLRVLRVAAPADAELGEGAAIVDVTGGELGPVTSRAFSERAQAWLVMASVKLDALANELRLRDATGGLWPAQPAPVDSIP
jgi:folate-binding protein YgfZ